HVQSAHKRRHADQRDTGLQRVRHLAGLQPEEPINNSSLYIVKANSFDLFINKIYNLCYNYFLKHLQQPHSITTVKHPSTINNVSYR
ncbi:MAG: hypothetical protein ACKPKO_16345, partial [Candidatus Fonsibacter sp.]